MSTKNRTTLVTSVVTELPKIKIDPPNAADMGALATFALNGNGQSFSWSGSESSKARIMAAKLIEFRLRPVAKDQTEQAIEAHNQAVLTDLRTELKKPKPCPNHMRDLIYKLKTYNPPCQVLCITAKGWVELAAMGITEAQVKKQKGCGY